ncbi:hypothetical protein SprV_0301185300 [Sparganum proliferum]
MGTQHSSPGSMTCGDAGVEITKDNELVRLRHSRQECVQVLVEFVPRLVTAGHRRDVDVDDCGKSGSPERQTEAHQAIVDTLRQIRPPSHDVVPDGKGDTRVPSLRPGATAPEKGVAGTNLLQLTLFGEADLAECSNVHLVARQFTSH